MQTALTIAAAADNAPALAGDLADALRYLDAGIAPATRRAYGQQWRAFVAYCDAAGVAALPAQPAAVAAYVTARAGDGLAFASIRLALAAIGQAHKLHGLDTPTASATVQAIVRGIARTHGTAQRQVAPLLPAELRQVGAALGDSAGDVRDRALLLLGFGGAFRRSELVALDVADVTPNAGGVEITIRRSKTDQTGAGRVVAVPFGSSADVCPVRALQAWIALAGGAGALFRSVDRHGNVSAARLTGGSVARIVKARCAAVGLDAPRYSGHSLRAGLATAAALAGRSDRAIMQQTGHRSRAMVDRYVRAADRWRDNAAAGLL
jgi:integrase